MKRFILAIWLLFLSFDINNATQISNLETIVIPSGTSEFTYQFVKPTEVKGKDVYFYLGFTEYATLKLTIRDEDKNEEKIDVDFTYAYRCYKIAKLKSQIFTFIFNNDRGESYTMHFIDGSREINFNTDEFLSFHMSTYGVTSPFFPLIFNLGLITENITAYYEEDKEDFLYNTTYLFEYCIDNERECVYQGFDKNITLEKGKKYKIKLNYYKDNSGYYKFKEFIIKNIFKEAEFGRPINYGITKNRNNYYCIINVKEYEHFNVIVVKGYEYYMAFITEEEKKSFFEKYNDFNYDNYYANTIIELNNEKDYLFIRIDGLGQIDPYQGLIYLFNTTYYLHEDTTFEIDKGGYVLINIYKIYDSSNKKKYILASSNNNLHLLQAPFNFGNLNNYVFLINNENNNEYIYIDSSKEKTILKYYAYSDEITGIQNDFKLYLNLNLTNSFTKYGPDALFMRVSSHSIDEGLQTLYYFDIDEKYYLYNKKFFGNVNFYKYIDELNAFDNMRQFAKYHFYHNLEKYKTINNELLIVSGYQLFSFVNSLGAFYDLFFQKVNDLEYIQINSNMFPLNNLVRLLNANKTYYLNFTVDHLIKLDNKFLDAKVTFTDENGTKYILNKENKIIKDLKGNNITVKSNKNALLYFYKKMDEKTELGMIEFDKSQKGKNMKIDIKNKKNQRVDIYILKDFGFKGYYPMLNEKSWDSITTANVDMTTIYAQNLYDNLEIDLYEDKGEKYFIYIFDSTNLKGYPIFNSEIYSIGEPIYEDNLMTPGNTFNFAAIPPKANGSIIINEKDKSLVVFQFKMCKSKTIKYKLENSKKYFQNYYDTYPIEENINEDKELTYIIQYSTEILYNSFQSDNEFLFSYSLISSKYNYNCNKNINSFSILSVNELSKNLLKVKFIPISYCFNKYYLIIGIKEDNSYQLLSNPCDVSKLFNHNSISSSFIIKSIYEESPTEMIISNVNISELNVNEDSELIMTIVGQTLTNKIYFYEPLMFKLEKKNPIEFRLGENVDFNIKTKNFFKLDYKHESDKPKTIYIYIQKKMDYYIFLTINGKIEIKQYNYREYIEGELFHFTLAKSETIYIEFFMSNSESDDIDNIWME